MTALGGLGRALAVRDFRIYWLGMSVSTIGTWTYFTALGWLTWELTHSTTWLGLIVFIEVVPQVVLVPVVGALLDRLGFHRVNKAIQIFAGSFIAVLAALTLLELVSIEVLVVFALLKGLVMAFHGPAQLAVVGVLVPRGELSSAVALQSATVQIARFAGPAVAGVILVTSGAGLCFAVNACTYFGFWVALSLLHYRDRPQEAHEREGIGTQILDGLRYVGGHYAIRTLLVATVFMSIALRPFIELMPGIADQLFGRGAEGLATLLSAAGLGATGSALWLAGRGRTAGLTAFFAAATALGGLALAAFILTPVFWLAVAIVVVVGFSSNAASICGQILMQNAVDPLMRARVMSLLGLTFRAIPAAAAFLAGGIASVLGLQTPIVACAALGLMVAAALALAIRRGGLAGAAEA